MDRLYGKADTLLGSQWKRGLVLRASSQENGVTFFIRGFNQTTRDTGSSINQSN